MIIQIRPPARIALAEPCHVDLAARDSDYDLSCSSLIALRMDCVRSGAIAGASAASRTEGASAAAAAAVVASASSSARAVPVAAHAALSEAARASVAVASTTAGSSAGQRTATARC